MSTGKGGGVDIKLFSGAVAGRKGKALEEIFCSDNALSPICDNSNDASDILNPPAESIPYKIPMKIIERVMDNHYKGDGTVHPRDHLLFLHELCGLFKCAGISMDEVRKKLFSVSLSGKAAHWYKLLENRHSLGWEEIASLFYSKFYPPHEVHIDRNYIYNFYPRDGESISQAWGRLKSLMLKCPIHELPRNVIVNNFYARLSGQHKDYLDACSEGSFTSKEVEARWDLLDRIKENAEGWENNEGYADKPPFKPLPPKEGNEEKEEKKKKKKKKKENKKKEVTAYPRVNEITLGNRKYVAPNDYYDNESEYDDLPMLSTYISDHDLNEHTTFDIANLWETNSENDDDNNCHSVSAIHASSHNDIESSKLGEEVFENPFATDHYVFDTSPSNNNDGIPFFIDNIIRFLP
ncbi:hypothetical protein QYE76_057134 [Lolium multiflorum]|uniref:Retrotransposon gag domain-containing protein n=1 Tax=Lolium multiflorum TaxID=4521 RepID=A0AAD8T3U6_LOLMU|nr:hypothetical protein QYE76_057134 [Lolium multiflorum]